MDLNLDVAATLAEDQGSPYPVSEGIKRVKITGVAIKEFQKEHSQGTGAILSFMVLNDGPEKLATFDNWFSIHHSNPKAQSLGRSQLAHIGRACGMATVGKTEELIGHEIMVMIKHIPPSDRYPYPSLRLSNFAPAPSPHKDKNVVQIADDDIPF